VDAKARHGRRQQAVEARAPLASVDTQNRHLIDT